MDLIGRNEFWKMGKFEGKVAVVTGGTSGIGLEAAQPSNLSLFLPKDTYHSNQHYNQKTLSFHPIVHWLQIVQTAPSKEASFSPYRS
ncbi:hypothetical protein EHS13_23770 [Paenibacillus psychroresistens]|uniref:Uncharacterized protein n=1 Tax=Paenibacillus psychroresistens TaxID=1778678 RepID=A0A6B8RQ99_9BACL|nr:hypothetical protein EHS13_23770 [Paenibacillus psychroresistens]